MKPIISLKHITKKINEKQILYDITFSVKKGEVFGFIGPNGAGKTTTLKIILGIISPTSGEISILEQNPGNKKVAEKIGFMPENTYLYKYLTGDEFLDFSASFYHFESKKAYLERKQWLLEKVGLTGHAHKKLSTYSKGMLQRIGIAQAIIHNPEIVFLDEPMSGLDPIGRKMIKDLLLELRQQGKTLFLNSHILSDVEAICDRFAILSNGKILVDMQVSDLKMPLEDFFIQTITQK